MLFAILVTGFITYLSVYILFFQVDKNATCYILFKCDKLQEVPRDTKMCLTELPIAEIL